MIFLAVTLLYVGNGLSGSEIAAENTPEGYPPKTGLIDLRRTDEHTLTVHWRDGYVIHHKIGQKRTDEKVVLVPPLAVALASNGDSYQLFSRDDNAFANGLKPDRVNRKSKGTDFAWIVDRWVNNHAENDQPDFAAEHWIYLHFSEALRDGKTYELRNVPLALDGRVAFNPAGSLSDSVHVNLLGYRPDAPEKFGYLYAWEGDGGGMDVRPYVGHKFAVVEAETGKTAYSETVKYRFPATNPETQQMGDTPNGNFLGADVAECDFSEFQTQGQYYLEIPGVGRSRVFAIQPDVYRAAFHCVMKGVLGNRSGIALSPPNVPYRRPAPHNVKLTPAFAGKLKYTRSRYCDRVNPDYSPDDKPAIEAGILGDLDLAGWYQDAGDWDSYVTHIQVPQNLMLAYELAPQNFSPNELALPDHASKLPDILKEAEWLPSFCYRLRHELLDKKYGTGGLGLRICGDHFGSDTGPQDVGRGSWQDVDRIWTASGEDPISTLGYAGIAAQFALCLKQAGVADPLGIDWTREAKESFEWASHHSQPGDEKKDDYASYKIYALCGLSLLTGSADYQGQLLKLTADFGEGTRLWWSALDGPSAYLVGPGSKKNPQLVDRFTKAVLGTADAELSSASKRALRWAGDWGMPMLIGQQTTPWVAPLAVASVITRFSDPARSKVYFGAVETTADYFLGTNPLNQTWVTGLGPKYPRDPFHMDGWYEEGQYPRPGIVPYGPWLKAQATGQGPWDHDWANKSVYPAIDEWPGAERWFNNRCSPLNNEFTIHQNIGPSALVYGFLCGGSKL